MGQAQREQGQQGENKTADQGIDKRFEQVAGVERVLPGQFKKNKTTIKIEHDDVKPLLGWVEVRIFYIIAG